VSAFQVQGHCHTAIPTSVTYTIYEKQSATSKEVADASALLATRCFLTLHLTSCFVLAPSFSLSPSPNTTNRRVQRLTAHTHDK
jgi:hypothetical protein